MTKVYSGRVNGSSLVYNTDSGCIALLHVVALCLGPPGYTSIGEVNNTKPNPALLVEGCTYAPAYNLKEEELERAGRQSRSV